MSDALYVADGELFESTELTRGPWDPGSQHGGPPSGLLGRALEGLPEAGEFQLARVTFEFLRAVPVAPLAVAARIARPGRRVQMVEAELRAAGEPVLRAIGWRIRTAPVALPAEQVIAVEPPPLPEHSDGAPFFRSDHSRGFEQAMDWRSVEGSFREPGPATNWTRMRQPLVAGEEPTPLQRLLVAGDSANGLSSFFDPRRHFFINVELTVHVERLPEGEWICLEAATYAQPHGVGTAEAVIYDRRGRIGRAMQALLISER